MGGLGASSSLKTKEYGRMKILAIGLMIAAIVLAWFFSLSFLNVTPSMTMGAKTNGAKLPIMTMSALFNPLDLTRVSSFILIWIVGMVAMMFPAMIPVVLVYNGLRTKFELDRPLMRLLGTPLFLGGYLLLYAILGIGVFATIYMVFHLSSIVPSLSVYAIPVAAGILLAAGAWQLTPLKNRCLSNCASPFGFFLMHAKKGLVGAFRMGAEHGYYCVGCCYLYMLVMLGVAAMSIPSMVLLTTLITIEKLATKGAAWFKWASATMFTALGLGLLFSPQLFGFA